MRNSSLDSTALRVSALVNDGNDEVILFSEADFRKAATQTPHSSPLLTVYAGHGQLTAGWQEHASDRTSGV